MTKRHDDFKPHTLMIREAALASLVGEDTIISAMRYILVIQLEYMTGDQFVATVQHVAETILRRRETE